MYIYSCSIALIGGTPEGRTKVSQRRVWSDVLEVPRECASWYPFRIRLLDYKQIWSNIYVKFNSYKECHGTGGIVSQKLYSLVLIIRLN